MVIISIYQIVDIMDPGSLTCEEHKAFEDELHTSIVCTPSALKSSHHHG